MNKETNYTEVFFDKPTITHHGTELVDLDKILKKLDAGQINIRLKSSNVKMQLTLGEVASQLTVTFREHEEA